MNGTSEQYVGGHPGDQLFFVAFAQVLIIMTYIIIISYNNTVQKPIYGV